MIPTYQEIVRTVPTWLFSTWITILGACVGSFLNVCIYRIPKEESVVTPRSHCGCGKLIAWYDNIPILSWLILRGRARCCGRPFSFRYPAIELLTAVLFLLCWTLFPAGKAVAGMVLCSIVICAFFIDFDHMIIPDAFTIGGAAVGVVLSFALPSLHDQAHGVFMVEALRSTQQAVLGLFVGSALVLWIALFAEAILKKEAMGFGDTTLMAMVGAALGPGRALLTIFAGAFIAAVVFLLAVYPVVWVRSRRRGTALEVPLVPFGVFLSPAALLTLLWGDALIRWYLERMLG